MSRSDGTCGGSGGGWLRRRPERVDELKYVVGELTSTVGGGQAFDQLQPAVAVLELEELLAVDRRPHVERAKRLRAYGRVEDDENARCSWPKSNIAHWSSFAPKCAETTGLQWSRSASRISRSSE